MSQVVRKRFQATFTKSADTRVFDVTLSTPREDRDRDHIPLEGWIVPPVVALLWAHDTEQFPLGRVTNIRVLPDRLAGTLSSRRSARTTSRTRRCA